MHSLNPLLTTPGLDNQLESLLDTSHLAWPKPNYWFSPNHTCFYSRLLHLSKWQVQLDKYLFTFWGLEKAFELSSTFLPHSPRSTSHIQTISKMLSALCSNYIQNLTTLHHPGPFYILHHNYPIINNIHVTDLQLNKVIILKFKSNYVPLLFKTPLDPQFTYNSQSPHDLRWSPTRSSPARHDSDLIYYCPPHTPCSSHTGCLAIPQILSKLQGLCA